MASNTAAADDNTMEILRSFVPPTYELVFGIDEKLTTPEGGDAITFRQSHSKQDVDGCSTIDEIASVFEKKSSVLRMALQLKCVDQISLSRIFAELEPVVGSLHATVTHLRKQVQKRVKNLEVLKALSERLKLLDVCLDSEIKKIPSNDNKENEKQGSMNNIPTPKPMLAGKQPATKEQTKSQIKKCSGPPKITSLISVEFQKIPKYLKGRLSLENVNNFIESFNKTISLKYELIATPRCNLGTAQFKKIEEFQKQESKETKGIFFCVHADLKSYGQVKVDNNTKNMLTILRHCARMKEIRGPGPVVRYAVVPC